MRHVAGGALVLHLARASEVRALASPTAVAGCARCTLTRARPVATTQKAAASSKGPAPAAERAHVGEDGGGAPNRQGGLARLRAGARRRRTAGGAAAAVDAREQAPESSDDEAGDAGLRAGGAQAAENERGGAQPAVSGKVVREERRQEKERLKEAAREQQEQKVRARPQLVALVGRTPAAALRASPRTGAGRVLPARRCQHVTYSA